MEDKPENVSAPCESCCTKESCGSCGSCPCMNPEALKEKIVSHPQIVENVQAMLFWRRPIPMAILLSLIELLFIFIKKAELTFLPVAVLFVSIFVLGKIIINKFGEAIFRILFPEIENKGSENEPNRIRPVETIADIVTCTAKHVCMARGKLCSKVNAPGITGLSLKCGVLFGLFLFFCMTGTFWLIFVVLHLILLVPGIVLHPKVFEAISPYMEKVKGMCPCCKPKQD